MADNALGLDFDQEPDSKKEKTKPYINPERVLTGGPQREKPTVEALEERITRIREKNELIKKRRLHVQADEDAFRKSEEEELAKQAHNRKVQSDIDRTRDENAQRKMNNLHSREWDSGKPSLGSDNYGPPQANDPLGGTASASAVSGVSDSIWAAEAQEDHGDPAPSPEGVDDAGNNWSRGGRGRSHQRGRVRGRARRGSKNFNNRRNEAKSGSPAISPDTTEDKT